MHLNGLGKIEGTFGSSLHGKPYFAFERVPYAAAPINENRFRVSFIVL